MIVRLDFCAFYVSLRHEDSAEHNAAWDAAKLKSETEKETTWPHEQKLWIRRIFNFLTLVLSTGHSLKFHTEVHTVEIICEGANRNRNPCYKR